MKGKPKGFGKKVGAIVYRAMVDTINVPSKDHFQIITEHDGNSLIYDPSYTGWLSMRSRWLWSLKMLRKKHD